MINVAQMVDSLNVGGAESVAVELASELAKRGLGSHVIATRSTGPLATTTDERVRVWSADRGSRFDLRGAGRITEYLRDQHIDVVHSHSHTTAYLLNFVRRLSRQRFHHVLHDHFGPGPSSWRVSALDAVLLHGIDGCLAVTPQIQKRAARLLRLPRERCVYAPNPVALPKRRPEYRHGHVVVQVANLVPAKGHLTALAAAASLRTEFPDLDWQLVGNAPSNAEKYVARVHKSHRDLKLEESVRFLGLQPSPEDLLVTAQVGVLTSNVEGLPLALLEYMASGLPVVVTDVGACGDVVRRAGCGFVVTKNDAAGTARQIARILEDVDLARRLGTSGRLYVEAHHSLGRACDTAIRLYETIA